MADQQKCHQVRITMFKMIPEKGHCYKNMLKSYEKAFAGDKCYDLAQIMNGH